MNISEIMDKNDVKPYDKWPSTNVAFDPVVEPIDSQRIANDPSSVDDWLDKVASNPFSKPTLLIKSSSFYFNITRSASFENIVFDGIDAFGANSLVPARECIIGTEVENGS